MNGQLWFLETEGSKDRENYLPFERKNMILE